MRGSRYDRSRCILAMLLLCCCQGPARAAGETCIIAQAYEVCVDPGEIARLVDPAALRRFFVAQVPNSQRRVFLEGRQAIAHARAPELKARWNQVVARVLKHPGDRAEFYRAVFSGAELNKLLTPDFGIRPVMRLSGIPHAPRMSFGLGVMDIMQLMGDTQISQMMSQVDPQVMLAMLNAKLEAQGPDVQVTRGFITIPLLAEFVYQLRLIYRELDKDVVVFEDILGSGPCVDFAGTLYVPRSFFERYDHTEQELALIHEAAHLLVPPGTLLMQLFMNRLPALGAMGDMFGASQFKERLKRSNPDVEIDIDAAVLLFLGSQADLRRRYQALFQRLAPGSHRVAIIGYLNEQYDRGAWPRPPVRLGPIELGIALRAMALYESFPPGPQKLEAMMILMEAMVAGHSPEDRAVYKPLYELLIKHQMQNPQALVAGTGLRPRPSDQEAIEQGLTEVFNDLLERWRRQ